MAFALAYGADELLLDDELDDDPLLLDELELDELELDELLLELDDDELLLLDVSATVRSACMVGFHTSFRIAVKSA